METLFKVVCILVIVVPTVAVFWLWGMWYFDLIVEIKDYDGYE